MRIERFEQPDRSARTRRQHQHPVSEWHFAVAGACGFDLGDRTVDFTAGDLLLIPPKLPHRIRMRRPGEWLRQIVVAARSEGSEDDALFTAFWERTGGTGILPIGTHRHPFFTALGPDLAAGNPLRRRAADLRFTALICELAACGDRPGHPAVARALELMRGNLAGRLTLAEIAKACQCSRSLIARCFRDEIGEPPLAHHLGLRLDLAAGLLRQGKPRIRAVAAAVGFSDPYHFSRCFRRRFGRPPSEWE